MDQSGAGYIYYLCNCIEIMADFNLAVVEAGLLY